MIARPRSVTAAAARAAHLVVDQPPYIFSDTAAAAILGDLAAGLMRYHEDHPAHPVLAAARGQVLCRSAADRGEAWLTFVSPAAMTALLAEFCR
jgi:hypothetical protein